MIWLLVLLVGGAFVADVSISGFVPALESVVRSLDPRWEGAADFLDFGIDWNAESVPTIFAEATVQGGRILLEWQPVEGAVEYRVSIRPASNSGSLPFTTLAETSGTSIELDLETFRWSRWTPDWDGEDIHPASLLGLFPSHGTIEIRVSAYNAEGRQIASNYRESVGPYGISLRRPVDLRIIDFQGSEEMGLIEVKRYLEGLFAYRERLIRDPFDEEALHVLFRAHYFGIDRSGRLRDLSLALHYGERLVALLPSGPVRDGYEKVIDEIAAALGRERRDAAEVAS